MDAISTRDQPKPERLICNAKNDLKDRPDTAGLLLVIQVVRIGVFLLGTGFVISGSACELLSYHVTTGEHLHIGDASSETTLAVGVGLHSGVQLVCLELDFGWSRGDVDFARFCGVCRRP